MLFPLCARMPPLPDCALQVKADVRSVAAIAALVSMALFGLEGIVRCEWGVSNGVQVPTVGVLGWVCVCVDRATLG